MAIAEKFSLTRPKATLMVRHWAHATPKATVLILHGMVEHSARYDAFANKLHDAGYAVLAVDHRGHGETTTTTGPRGYFAPKGGWQVVLEDITAVSDYVRKLYPDVPHFLFGHSMGSILLRCFLAQYGQGYSGAIICGTAPWPGLQGEVGLKLAQALAKVAPKATGSLLNAATFAGYNNGFEKRTDFDWLSRDQKEVDKYIADSECGFVPTNVFFRDLLVGTKLANADETYKATPKDLPLLLISGAVDPVGGKDAVDKVAKHYRAAGVAELSVVTYPEARHELLNETNRDEVVGNIVTWLGERL